MSKRRKKVKKLGKKDKKRRRKSSQSALSNLKVDKRISIASIPVTIKTDDTSPDIRPASFTYEVVHPNTGIAVAAHISHEMLAKISAAKGLLHFGFENPSLRDNPSSTWPHKWQYLSKAQRETLEKSGLPVLSQKYILMESLQIGSFGKNLYYSQNIEAFFESWVEIIWQEYVIEQELRRYQELHKHGQPVVTIDQSGEINLQNAETWIPLENCVVRIRSIWERLHKYIIPLYFTGKFPSDNENYWNNLDTAIRNMLNPEQLPLYELLYQFINYVRDPNNMLKSLRNNLIHNLSHRPTGVVPASGKFSPAFPRTVDDLHQIVLDERANTREALILMTAIIRAKTPANEEVEKVIS